MKAATTLDDFVGRHGLTRRRSVFGRLVHNIGRRIVGGEFCEGAYLPNEEDLIGRFAVSRTTLREAIKTLASKGLLEVRTRTGTRVRARALWHHTDPDVMVWCYETGPNQTFIDELRDLRRVLEPAAARRAAERATPLEVEEMGRAYERMVASIGDMGAHAEADHDFHKAIFVATHNLILGRMIDIVAVAIHGNIAHGASGIIAGQKMSLPFHRAVLEAIVARDPDAAESAAHRLLNTWNPVAGRVAASMRRNVSSVERRFG